MTTTVSDAGDLCGRLREFGLSIPDGIELVILPRDVDTAATAAALIHEADAATVRKLLAAAGLRVRQVEPSASRLPVAVQKSADWIAPTLFVTSLLLTQNASAVQIALGVIESYISDYLKGIVPSSRVQLSFVVETSRSGTTKRVLYQGPVSGIRDLARILRELHDA